MFFEGNFKVLIFLISTLGSESKVQEYFCLKMFEKETHRGHKTTGSYLFRKENSHGVIFIIHCKVCQFMWSNVQFIPKLR